MKIGWTSDLVGRLETLQVGYPGRLVVLRTVDGGVALEKQLHRRFAKLRVHGEWYRLTPDIVEAANVLASMQDLPTG